MKLRSEFDLLTRPHSLEHPELECPGPSQGDGLVASPAFINAIGGDVTPVSHPALTRILR